MALINCSECKKEISSDAVACPHCGKSNSSKLNLKAKVKSTDIIAGIFVVSIGLWWLIPSSKPDSHQSTISQSPAQQPSMPAVNKEIYQTTARHLFAEYEQNEVATDERIKNKKVILLGVIQSIDKSAFDSIIVNLETSNQFMPATMSMQDSVKQKVITLKKGNKVAITCESMSRLLGSPSGSDCIFTAPISPLPTYQ